MLPFIMEKRNCTGCMACANICPKQCIKMVYDEEGFCYPDSSTECINCKLCEKICPNNKDIMVKNSFHEVYALLTKDYDVWKRSTSGGAFSEICRSFDKNTVFFGASLMQDLNTHHICVESFDELHKITKSKYVQSYVGNSFSQAKDFLNKGKKVVFCGTPCIIAGFKSFLGKETNNNLLLIDLVCHGVGSKSVFSSCVKEMEKQFGKEISGYEFRSKRRIFEVEYLSKITFKSREEKYVINDPYIQLYLSQNCLRPSCGENCHYRREDRIGDITLADFKGLYHVFPELKGGKYNYSALIVNTDKGKRVAERIKNNVNMLSASLEDIKTYNPLFYRNTWFSKERSTFFSDFISNPQLAIQKWTDKAVVSKKTVKQRVFEFTPVGIRKRVIKYLEHKNEKK